MILTSRESFANGTVTIHVGQVGAAWEIHRKVLLRSSHTFQTALFGTYANPDGTITIPEGNAETYDIYFNYLYTRDICTDDGEFTPGQESANVEPASLVSVCQS